MPSPLPRQVQWSLFARRSPLSAAFPMKKAGSAPATVFSGPAQRSLTLRPTHLRSRQATLYIESSDSFVASAAASIATGWSEPVPGGVTPAEVQRLSRRTISPNQASGVQLSRAPGYDPRGAIVFGPFPTVQATNIVKVKATFDADRHWFTPKGETHFPGVHPRRQICQYVMDS